MAVCGGTKRDGGPCTLPAAKGSDYCYLHDPDPAVATRRSRNASRAAMLGNSKVGAEIRSTRLMVRELLEVMLCLFHTVVHPGTGEPYTNAEVARMSMGVLTEEEIEG